MRRFLFGSVVGVGGALSWSLYRSDQWSYDKFFMPLIHRTTSPEQAHRLGVQFLSFNLHQNKQLDGASTAEQKENVLAYRGLFQLRNPIGIAAGFDKDGECIPGLSKLGFGFVEIGSVTPEPQPGNDKPRVFRLGKDKAVINRYGFNSAGHEQVFENVRKGLEQADGKELVLGVNLGKNKTAEDALQDYVKGIRKFYPVADYFVVNVSSPNTPGLRSLQKQDMLAKLLQAVMVQRDQCAALQQGKQQVPVFVKIAPDLSKADKKDIATVLTTCGVDGLIVSNTTISRDGLVSEHREERGGLSGAPVKDMSTRLIREMYELTEGKILIVGVGGVESGRDALEKIKNGATFVQLYTSMIFRGPAIANTVVTELETLVKAEGVENYTQLIGANCGPK